MVSHSYVVDRMMGEFAAASVALAKGIDEEVGIEDLEAENRATSAAIRERIEDILLSSYPEVIPYYTLMHQQTIYPQENTQTNTQACDCVTNS